MSYYGNNYGGGFGGFISSLPPVTKNIVAINVLVFIATLVNQQFMVANFAMFYPTSPFFRPWQIITHMFMHGGFWHIFFNMYSLLMFGTVLERSIGSKKFLIFYFVTGLGAVALHTGVGLFVHELPNIGANCGNILPENSVMTVEPGLYIPGWGGVRIEDQGIVTKDGYENLISATHELIEL